MKKSIFLSALLMSMFAFTLVSCDKDDDPVDDPVIEDPEGPDNSLLIT